MGPGQMKVSDKVDPAGVCFLELTSYILDQRVIRGSSLKQLHIKNIFLDLGRKFPTRRIIFSHLWIIRSP